MTFVYKIIYSIYKNQKNKFMKILVKLIMISILLLILASCGETKYLYSLKPNYTFNLVVASEGVKYLVMTDSVGHLFAKHYLSRGSRITLYELPAVGIIYDPTTKLLPYARIIEQADFCETDSIISSKLCKNWFGLSGSVFF